MRNWFTGSALWLIVGAACAIGVFGHISTLGVLAWFAIPITIGVEVYCARAAVHYRNASTRFQRGAVAGLLVLCSIISVIFEHRGMEAINSISNAEYQRAFSERAEALEIKGALGSDYNSLPALPSDPAALAAMSTRALNRIEATRANWENTPFGNVTDPDGTPQTQLEALTRATAAAAAPLPQQLAKPLDEAAIWFVVGFVLLMRLFGFWSIAPTAQVIALPKPAPEKEAPPPALKPGAAMVQRRYAIQREADRIMSENPSIGLTQAKRLARDALAA